MIDLHCHLLPAVDDGPPDMEASLRMARAALQEGINTIVATPHVDLRYGLAPQDVGPAVEAMHAALSDAQLPLAVLTGAEIALTRWQTLDDETLSELCLGASSCVMVESPYTRVGDLIENAIFDLERRGFRPLLAHPERCPEFQRDPPRLERLVERGVLCSVTAGSLVGQFGRTAKRFVGMLLDEDLVHNVSSDAHDAGNRRPAMRGAFQDTGAGAEVGSLEHWLTQTAPAAILADEELPPRPRRPTQSRRGG